MAAKKTADISDADKVLMEVREAKRAGRFAKKIEEVTDFLRENYGTFTIPDGYIDPEWLKKLPPLAMHRTAIEKRDKDRAMLETIKEESVGYSGEWYQGPVPSQYTGPIPKTFDGGKRRIALDDERKRIYCYEEDGFGNLNRTFVAQTDSVTVAEWIVSAHNGRLVGKNSNEALLNAEDRTRVLVRRLEDAERRAMEMQHSRDVLREMNRTVTEYHTKVVEELETQKGINKAQGLEIAKTKQALEDALKQLNERKEARMAEIKDAGTRKLRLRTKE